MIHIDIGNIEKLVFCPDELNSEQRAEYLQHIEVCAQCNENYEVMKEFLKSFQKEITNSPTEQEKDFVNKLLSENVVLPEHSLVRERRVEKAISTFFEIVEPKKLLLPQKVVDYIAIHPIKSIGGFAIAVCLVILALFFVKPYTDKNPDYAKAKDDFLIVYNKEGKELWKKRVGDGFDAEYIEKSFIHGQAQNYYLNTADIDDDGINEVLVTFRYGKERNDKNVLYCFDSRGNTKWVYKFNRWINFGKEVFDDEYNIHQFIVGDFDKNGSKEVVFIANHTRFYPACIVKLNGKDGKFISEYWHPGSIRFLKNIDYDGDSIEEIMATGENNGYNLAFLSVIDPRFLDGHAPAPVEYTPANVASGIEKYYVLFERSDIGRHAYHKRNFGITVEFLSDHNFRIIVLEELKSSEYGFFLYFFNSKMECIKVDADDKLVQYRNKLVAEGKLQGEIDANYLENIRRGIRYWNGEEFVYYPTINKRYLEVKQRYKENLP